MHLLKIGLLIDGTGLTPRESCYLAIEEGYIAGIGKASDFGAEQVAAAVDYSQYAVIPGLIDPHVHLFLEGISDLKTRTLRWKDDRDTTLLRAVNNLASTIRQGVTTVRDLGGSFGINTLFKKAVKQGIIKGPRILTARQAISITGGHFHYAGGREADGPENIIRAVREQVKGGADCIKIMMTGCVNFVRHDAGVVELSLPEAQAAVNEARHLKRTVSAHANGIDGVRQALAVGVTTLEHAALIDENIVEKIADSEVFWIPTLVPFERMLDYGRTHQSKTLPAQGVENVYVQHQAMVRKGYQAGAKIVAGTDAGALGVEHGDIWRELALLVECGLPAAAAIHAATGLAAKAIGMEPEIGTVAVGKRADLVVLAGNPLLNIADIRKVVKVFINGKAYYG
ncbi:metal-dependent hydrolase family protein [Sporomusa acidovorans]|uniref:Imidazolonepropionase n=1 Tax=Sporomusa acidovorans (strain ATCC 49682 / DSM 3132 / Mol) TaxID=1123286 RepID=A0ABZ3J0T7_SPOA4|nr:amidohydrolase family protein [Sporomusa acidovorans]OZC14971.1 imidazolonepropionase [Sporomusa acidovorans DSM 3132]SDE83219.1 Imidazolonepropionase [Sporomusa acidovorans]